MAEVPPRDPRAPAEDETVVLDEWGPETVVVDEPPAPPPRRPRLGLWPWLLALLVLVLGVLAAAFLLSRDDDEAAAPTTTAGTTTASLITVPDVVGTTSSEATATLRAEGLEANLVPVPSDRPAGTVVAQDPPPGRRAPEGSTVRLNVAEPREAATPPVTTAPAATTAAPAPAPEPERATVPDAVGQELAEAARAFADEGLKVAVRYVPSSEAAGRVVAQAQPPGTERARGDSVQLNVSIGAEPLEPVAVPGVTGRRLDQARSTLEQAGFEVLALGLEGEVRREDTVSSQSPAAGASTPRGSLVLLYVA
jgi:beta-lactam-binding protein with PASTA domain